MKRRGNYGVFRPEARGSGLALDDPGTQLLLARSPQCGDAHGDMTGTGNGNKLIAKTLDVIAIASRHFRHRATVFAADGRQTGERVGHFGGESSGPPAFLIARVAASCLAFQATVAALSHSNCPCAPMMEERPRSTGQHTSTYTPMYVICMHLDGRLTAPPRRLFGKLVRH